MKLRRSPLLALILATTVAFAIYAPSPRSMQAQGAISASMPKAAELYTGIATPASSQEVKVATKGFDGRIVIAELHVTNGAAVMKGDLLATLSLADFDARHKAAEEAIEEQAYEVSKAETGLNHEREVREYNIAKADQDVEAAERELKEFKEFGKADKITQAKQRVDNARISIEDQEDELKQLRKLYGKNELASESQDIVLKRAERRLEDSRENLKIEENKFKVFMESVIPAEEWKLPFEIKKAKRAYQAAQLDRRENIEKKEKALDTAKKALEGARKKLEEMAADKERLEIKASSEGTVIFGSLSGGNGFDGGVSKGATVRSGQVLFSIANMNAMHAEIDVPVGDRGALLAKPNGKVGALPAKIVGISLIADGNRVRAKIAIEAKGAILVGQSITFKQD